MSLAALRWHYVQVGFCLTLILTIDLLPDPHKEYHVSSSSIGVYEAVTMPLLPYYTALSLQEMFIVRAARIHDNRPPLRSNRELIN